MAVSRRAVGVGSTYERATLDCRRAAVGDALAAPASSGPIWAGGGKWVRAICWYCVVKVVELLVAGRGRKAGIGW